MLVVFVCFRICVGYDDIEFVVVIVCFVGLLFFFV